ncbi:MAG: type ISP restriction/modification enzyme, partial [Candidatus Poribacteria bacterium]
MIESTDFLLHKHFGKILASKNVEILDPATGTGTFICDIIDHLPERDLKYKYQNEIHCNEIAILPYYIANLNIEATFKQKMGVYEEFKNICFVDTLDNTEALKKINKQGLFSISAENAERVKRQNKKKISVIIGNPPYNAKQENYNFQNANRFYKYIDDRIRETYVKEGKAQNQITLFDPYVRFLRWASDRIDHNGIISLITNRSYIDSMAFDGFRKCVEKEFSDIYIIDTRSDVRANPKISGTKYNVFGIQTGVAIIFLVKKADQQGSAKISYSTLQDEQTRKEKLGWFNSTRFKDIAFEPIRPDEKSNWLDLTDNDFDELIPLIDKQAKSGLSEKAIFKLFSRGVETTRDKWVYDINESALVKKMGFFVDRYNSSISNGKKDLAIKWCSSLEASFQNAQKAKFNDKIIRRCLFRPYYKPFYYSDKLFSHRLTQNHFDLLGPSLQSPNLVIAFNGLGMDKPFSIVACDGLVDIQIMPNGQTTALYRYDENERQID